MEETSMMSDVDYEVLVQNVHKSIMLNEGVSHIEVAHNKKILGRSGQYHQIDVYWKFSLANKEYQTAIECRRYKNKISIGKIRDFNSVLEDIGNINGTMITTSGFQEGAVKFALHRKIKLLILRAVNDSDLENFLKVITINIHVITKRVISWHIHASTRCLDEQQPSISGLPLRISGMNNEIGLHDKNGTLIKSFHQIANELSKKDGSADGPEFGEIAKETIDVSGMYLKHEVYGLIALESFSATYVTNMNLITIVVEDPHPTHYIMKDLDNDRTLHIHESHNQFVLKEVQTI